MRRVGLGLGLVAAALFVAFLVVRDQSARAPQSAGPGVGKDTSARGESEARVDEPADPGELLGARQPLDAPRRPAAPAELTTVLAPDGGPIVGAEASWTALRPEFLGLWVDWSRQPWDAIDAGTRTAITDEAGRLEFDPPVDADDQHPGAVWVTHPDFLPTLVALPPGSTELPATIAMEPAVPMRVRVVDGHGDPVAGATVEQLEPVPASALADFLSPQALRVLHRIMVTDTEGWVSAAGWGGETLVEARFEGLTSGVWIGEPRERVELVLRSTFEVRGTVDYSLDHEMHGPQRVWCVARRGSRETTQAVLPVEQGQFGPASLALQDADGFTFRLEGFNAEVQVVDVDPPEPGGSVRVDFVARAGLDVWTQIIDTNGDPVPRAESVVSWERDGRTIEVFSHTPAEPGFYPNRGVPPGPVLLRARAPGFAPAAAGPIQIPEDPPVFHVLKLEPGRSIRGRVVLEGEAVEDFDIVHWSGQPDFHQVEHFRSRNNGEFEVDAAAQRVVHVLALSDGAGPSRTATADPTSPVPIELELTRLVRGRGLVTDAVAGEPLSGVEIQPFVSDGHRAVTPVGAVATTGTDGTFDWVGFTEGRSRVRFSKAGFSNHWADVFGRAGETLDLGTVALTPPQGLTVRLVGADYLDFSEYMLESRGEALGKRRFPPGGVLEIAEASAGVYYFQVSAPGRLTIHQTAILSPGQDWVIAIPVGSQRKLRAHFDIGDMTGRRLSAGAYVPNANGRQTAYSSHMTDQRVIDYPLTVGGNFDVYVTDETGRRVAEAQGVVPPGDEDFDVDVRPLGAVRRFRVLGPEGAPVSGGDFAVYDPATWVGGTCQLDADGRGTISGLESNDNVARVVHPTDGLHFNLPVNLPADENEEISIELGPIMTLEVELLDGLEPLAGVSCAPWEAHRLYAIPPRSTGVDGAVRWDSLGAGPYVIEVHHPDIWPTEARVELGPQSGRTSIQARRRGSVTLELRSSQGAPLGDQLIEIESTEFTESVTTWIQDGRVQSSTAAPRTDGQGQLSLSGLPHGTYVWTAKGSGGSFRVHPGTTGFEVLTVP